MKAIMKPRSRAYFFAKECDPQSNCCNTSRKILLLLDHKQNIPYQNERIKEEIWVMLDHEKLLSEYQCCTLAKLTLQELLKYMVQYKYKEDFITFIEDLVVEMEKRYTYELNYHHDEGGERHPIDLQGLTYRHMGHGMEYLKHNSSKAKHDFRSSTKIMSSPLV